MSRIGKKPVTVPAGVTVTIDGGHVSVKGSKGELERTFSDLVTIRQEGEEICVVRNDETTESNAQHRVNGQWINVDHFNHARAGKIEANWPVVLHMAP